MHPISRRNALAAGTTAAFAGPTLVAGARPARPLRCPHWARTFLGRGQRRISMRRPCARNQLAPLRRRQPRIRNLLGMFE